MDKIGGMLGGSGGKAPQQNQGGQKEDYLDKGMLLLYSLAADTHESAGVDAVEKKFGGGKINPEQSRGMNEKVTDSAREMFEKATGYVCSLFLSNGVCSYI